MRMTDKQAEELKKQFEELKGGPGACMDCDDHPDPKLDNYCSEAHRAEGWAGIIVGLCEELLRYKALAKKKGWKEPRHDETTFEGAVPTDEAREGALQNRLAALGGELAALREEHETTAGGEYKRCSCDLCTIHRRLDDPNIEIQKLTEDLDALHDSYEEVAQRYDEGIANGNSIRTKLTRSIGFFTKGPRELYEVVAYAIDTAKKDPEFKSYYDERVRESRARTLADIKQHQQVRELEKKVNELSKRLEVLQGVVKSNPAAVVPTVITELEGQLAALAKELVR